MKLYGVDSKLGLIASTIMGSTETTLYTIAIYTSAVGIKKVRFVLVTESGIVGILVKRIHAWNVEFISITFAGIVGGVFIFQHV